MTPRPARGPARLVRVLGAGLVACARPSAAPAPVTSTNPGAGPAAASGLDLDLVRTRVGALPLGQTCDAGPGELAYQRVRRAQDELARDGSTELGFSCVEIAADRWACRWTVVVRADVAAPDAPDDPGAASCCERFALTVEVDGRGVPRPDTLACAAVEAPTTR
ncbi:MAG: hypothetical protein KA190_19175 [Kofleriaceae bacterium]|nr:hypothetical protein [Kofleriaceae bacterium]